jgi:hypothetical protein
MWFFSIRGTGNRPVTQSEAIYESEQLAQTAGTEYLKKSKTSVQRANDIYEIFTVTTGRQRHVPTPIFSRIGVGRLF